MIQRTFHENHTNNEQVCGGVFVKIQVKRIKTLPTQTFKMRLKSGTRLFRPRSIAFFHVSIGESFPDLFLNSEFLRQTCFGKSASKFLNPEFRNFEADLLWKVRIKILK